MKKLKFKPLKEFYQLRVTPFKLKVESASEVTDKFVKKFASKRGHIKVKCLERNLATVPSPSIEHSGRFKSAMEKEAVGSSETCMGEETLHQASVDSHRELASCVTSNIHSASACPSSLSEDVYSGKSLKVHSISDDQQKSEDVNTFPNVVGRADEDVLNFQADGSSCVSKDNGVIMLRSNLVCDVDHKNVTSSPTSISSSCPAGFEKSVNVQSACGGSHDLLSVGEGNKCSVRTCKYSGETVKESVEFSERLGLSEKSSFRDDQSTAMPSKGVPSECSMDPVNSSLEKMIEKSGGSLEPESVFNNGNPSAFGSLISSDGNKHSKCNAPVTNRNVPPLHSQGTIANGGSDELVDVRVCDICGDVGREALLALCSKCADGAEHIYCMRVKMDNVPEGDWMCEDCMVMQEPKRQKQAEVERPDDVSNLSCLKEASKGLPTTNPCIRRIGEIRINHSSKTSCLSGKRHGSDIDVSLALKKRRFESNVQPVKSPGSGRKMVLSRVPSLKITNEGKQTALQISSFGNRFAKKVAAQANSPAPLRLLKSRSDITVRHSLNQSPKKAAELANSLSRPRLLKSRSDIAVRPSLSQSAKKVAEQAKSPSRPRLLKSRSDIAVRPSPKGGVLERSVQPLKSSHAGGNTPLTRVSSQMVTNKSKNPARPSSSFGDMSAKKKLKQACSSPGCRSSRAQQQSYGGDEHMCKDKSTNISDPNIEAQQPHEDANAERKTSKEHADDCHLTVKHPEKKLLKSASFTAVSSVPSNVSNAHFSHAQNVKDQKHSGGRNSAEKCDSVANKSLRLASSGAKKVNKFRTTVGSETAKAPSLPRSNVQDMNVIQVDGNSNVKALGSLPFDGQKCLNTLAARSIGENMSCGISSPVKEATSGPGWKASQSTELAKPGCSSGADTTDLVSSNEVIPLALHPMKDMPTPGPANVVPSGVSAVPESKCIWKGAFELEKAGKLPKDCGGIQAYLSTCASTKVLESVHKFCPKLLLKEVHRLDSWPIQFQMNHPTEQDIAVYFFAEDVQSYMRSYKILLEGMIKYDLALEANFDGVQFLIFSSSLLPARSQRWNSRYFLWGVFRVRKVDNSSGQNPSLNVATLSQGLCNPVTSGTQNIFFSASEAGSFSGSHTSHNSIQEPGSVDPMALHSSVSIKFMDQSFEHEVSSVEKSLGSQGKFFFDAHTLPFGKYLTEKERFLGGSLRSDNYQKGDECTNQDTKSLDKARIFWPDQSGKNNTVPSALDSKEIGLYSYGNHKWPNFPWLYESASKYYQENRPDLASGSSFSIDSGPSGSSDAGGCVKSDEGQVEQLQNPKTNGSLNLDLCLASGSETDEQVNLDLVLASPGTSKCGPKHCKEGSSECHNVSTILSLGMPCSNSRLTLR